MASAESEVQEAASAQLHWPSRWECPIHRTAWAPVLQADEKPLCGRRGCGQPLALVQYVLLAHYVPREVAERLAEALAATIALGEIPECDWTGDHSRALNGEPVLARPVQEALFA